jgi:hypothetical protein
MGAARKLWTSVFLEIIEHLVTDEYDIFIPLILTQVLYNTSWRKAPIKNKETKITCRQDYTLHKFLLNNRCSTKGNSDKAFVPFLLIVPTTYYIVVWGRSSRLISGLKIQNIIQASHKKLYVNNHICSYHIAKCRRVSKSSKQKSSSPISWRRAFTISLLSLWQSVQKIMNLCDHIKICH